jgi:predicted HAD superfamily Cof-like phosphohydrolase
MQKQINSVKDFHKAFKIGHSEIPIATLGDSKKLRYHLMKEENEEYLEAVQNDN